MRQTDLWFTYILILLDGNVTKLHCLLYVSKEAGLEVNGKQTYTVISRHQREGNFITRKCNESSETVVEVPTWRDCTK